MTTTSTLLELAQRCESATGPDETLDQDIGNLLWADQSDAEPRNVFDCYQPYTASLDAAMTLWPGEMPHLIPSDPRICTAMALRSRAGEGA